MTFFLVRREFTKLSSFWTINPSSFNNKGGGGGGGGRGGGGGVMVIWTILNYQI
jgi:hypothetical protein